MSSPVLYLKLPVDLRTQFELSQDQEKLRTMHPKHMRIRIVADENKILCQQIHAPLSDEFNLRITKVVNQNLTFTVNVDGCEKNVEHRFTKSGDFFIGVDTYLGPNEYLPSTKLEILPLNEKHNVLMKSIITVGLSTLF